MSGPHTWLATPAEAGVVAALLARFRDHMEHDEPTDESILQTVRTLIDMPQTEYLLAAASEGEPAGAVAQVRFRLSVWTGAPDCWLEDLFVGAQQRRQGLGEALVNAVIERAQVHGAGRVELDTNEDNAPALALYERCGFSTRSKGGPGRDVFLGRRV